MVDRDPGAPDALGVNTNSAIASIDAGVVPGVVSAGISTTTDLAAFAPGMLDLPFIAATRGVDALGSPIVTIVWTAIAEVRTLGYKVLRSETSSRDGADVVSDGLFAAHGGGGDYKWVDVTAPAAAAWYWIEEIELDGVTVKDHGPVIVRAMFFHRAFLAALAR